MDIRLSPDGQMGIAIINSNNRAAENRYRPVPPQHLDRHFRFDNDI